MFLLELGNYFVWVLLLGGFYFFAELFVQLFMDRFALLKMLGWAIWGQTTKVYQIFPPANNLRSLAAMENFYDNMSAIYSLKSNKDVFVTGKWHEVVAFELQSKGGKLAFFVRVNSWYEKLIKTALDSHFPGSRLVEVIDPLSTWSLEWTDGEKPYKDLFGTDIIYKNNDAHPSKHWSAFQTNGPEPNTDPMAQLISIMENIGEEDFASFQIMLRPRDGVPQKKQWQMELEKLRKEYLENSVVETDGEGQLQALTKEERDILNAISVKLGYQVFATKIRFCYLTNGKKKPGIIENRIKSFLQMFQTTTQEFGFEWESKTNEDSKGWYLGLLGAYIGKLEDVFYWKRERKYRKQRAYRGMFKRSVDVGAPSHFLDTASLAALFHFPITTEEDKSTAERISSAYGEEESASSSLPPLDLPG